MRSLAPICSSWVGANDGWCCGCPQCGVLSGTAVLWVRCWSSDGGRVHRCTRAYSTSGTRLSPYCRRHRGCVCCPPRTMWPLVGRSRPAGWFRTGVSWVCANDGWCFCCPHCGVWSGLGLLWVCCWSSSGGRVHRCMRAYSTSGTRLPPHSRRPAGWIRPGCPQCGVRPGHGIGGCAPIVGAGVVVRNAGSSGVVSMGH